MSPANWQGPTDGEEHIHVSFASQPVSLERIMISANQWFPTEKSPPGRPVRTASSLQAVGNRAEDVTDLRTHEHQDGDDDDSHQSDDE